MKALTRGDYRGRDGVWAVFSLDFGAEMRVGLMEADIGRARLIGPGGPALDRGWSIAPNRQEPPWAGRLRDDLTGLACPAATVVEGEGTVTITGGAIRAVVRLEPFGISWFRAGEAEPFLEDRRTQAYFLSRRTGAFAHHMARDAAERHHGLGDKSGPLDHTGRRYRIDAVDPCGFDAEMSDPLYKMIPFLIVDGPRGAHGVYWDNLARAEVDLGATLDNYHGLFRSYVAEEGDLDYWVIAGPGVRDVVKRFSWLTGGQALAPRWTFGFGMTSMAIADAADADARIRDFVAMCREHRIGCDGFHFGSGYTMIGPRRYAFNWNREKFPDPEQTCADLSAAGFRPVANLKPCLLDDHPRLGELLEAGGLVRDGETGEPATAQFWDGLGFHLDFTHPNGRAWWREGLERALLDVGLLIWNDNNEYEIWDEDAVCAGDGRPFPQRLARPAQALLMTKLAHETTADRRPAARPHTITRGGAAGIWRYGQTWSGDNQTAWKTLRFNLAQGLNMSLSGMFNIGHDVGGFHGPSPDPELLCRFVEFGAFWPRYIMNSWNSDEVTTLPWMHPEVIPQIRAAIDLRYRLVPYLYTGMRAAALADEPFIRPLFLDFPDDPAMTNRDDAFLFGDDLLVAPVLEQGARSRSVTLPRHPGGWYEVHDGRHHQGGTTVEVEAPLGRPPLFLKAGAMLPLAVAAGDRPSTDDPGRELAIYGTPERASAVLWEDDGVTADWRGGGTSIRFDLVRDGDELVIGARAEGPGGATAPVVTLRPVHGQALRIGRCDGVVLRL